MDEKLGSIHYIDSTYTNVTMFSILTKGYLVLIYFEQNVNGEDII